MAEPSVRIDKWLWACRFYKTRSLAKQEIDGGKVRVNGARAKPSREIKPGDEIKFRAGWDEKTVVVKALSDQRRSAPEAQELYEETEASIKEREDRAAERKAARGAFLVSDTRPTKKQRRQIHRFKRRSLEGDADH
jgi:ribosome-associated heat shock protein Hsp15